MTYRLALALAELRDEVNLAAPRRSKASDGWIGDALHASRGSDHNPWIKDTRGIGVVRAFDFTHDPASGVDCHVLAERIRLLGRAGDRRLASGGYVIWNRRIASGASQDWAWRPYSGANAHTRHAHVSVSREAAGYDDQRPWSVALANVATPAPTPAPPTPRGVLMALTDEQQAELLELARRIPAVPAAVWGHRITDTRVGMNAPAALVMGETWNNSRRDVTKAVTDAVKAAAPSGVDQDRLAQDIVRRLVGEVAR